MLKNNRKVKVLLSIMLFFVVVIGVFIYLIKYNSSYVVPKTKVSSQLIDKIRIAQTQGGGIELDNSELNQIISMYCKSEKKSSGLTIKGVKGDISEGKITLSIPCSYKGVNIFVSSKGNLSLNDNNIVYSPEKISVGKITLPKDYVLNKVKARKINGLKIEKNDIGFDKNFIPLKIKSMEINKDKVSISIEKMPNSIEEKLKSLDVKTKEKLKQGNLTSEEQKNIESKSESYNSSSSKNDSKNKSQSGEADAALNRISSGLNSAMGSVSTGAQKSVISEMISAANSMKGNPNANPYESAGGARGAYKNLSPQEKAELKSAVFSNIDGGDVDIVSKMIQ